MMELCIHIKCSTKEQHKKIENLCSESGLYIDLEQSWDSWVAETRNQEPVVQEHPIKEKIYTNLGK